MGRPIETVPEMRRLKIAARALAVLALLTGAAMPAGAETLLARGRYLVEGIAGCGNCHTPQGPKGPIPGKRLAGGLKIAEPGFTAFSTNITPDRETGIGTWTLAQIVTAIRQGRRPDGSLIGPVMPVALYRGISDRDVLAMAIYLKSVEPVRNRPPKSVYRIALPKNYGPAVGRVAEVPRGDPVRYGAYLAGPVGHCVLCHTPLVKGRPDFANRFGAGGQAFHGPWGVSASANITPHKTDGIGAWTDAEIKRAITKGRSRDGRKLLPPMGFAYYARMSAADLDAVVAYLRSLKPLPRK